MMNKSNRPGGHGRWWALVACLLAATHAAAQSAPPAAKPAPPVKAAKSAKQPAAPVYKMILEAHAMDLAVDRVPAFEIDALTRDIRRLAKDMAHSL